MYEAKYSKYLNDNETRFAEETEILAKLTPIEKGAGIPLYVKNKNIYVDNLDNHSMTIGGTSCGKSRGVCKTLIKSIIANKASPIINDPKGELYKSTAGFARDTHDIKVFNLRQPYASDRWNPLYLIYKYYNNSKYFKY